jgi:nucleotide-binding universal stress UspA family protein
MRGAGFKHITVPVNGSGTSQCGIRRALDLARDGTRFTFCSVWDPTFALLSRQAIGDEPKAHARRFCEEAKREALERGVAAHGVVLEGHPAAAICDYVRKSGSDAIVIGTRARTGIVRAALGSVAEALIHTCDVPIIVVHEDDAARPGPIGVAIDRSPAAATALGAAIELAGASACELLLIHAFSRADLQQTLPPNLSDYEQWKGAAQRDAAWMIEQAAARARHAGIPVETVMIDGNPSEVLLQTIETRKCSSIAVGTHGRTELGRLFLGSVSAALVERARIPVIVTK